MSQERRIERLETVSAARDAETPKFRDISPAELARSTLLAFTRADRGQGDEGWRQSMFCLRSYLQSQGALTENWREELAELAGDVT